MPANFHPTSRRNRVAVWIIDDDDAVRGAIAMLLESAGWRTRVSISAEEFLRDYRPGDAGCLVLDLHMPGMDGADLVERLGREGTLLPVVVVTAFVDNDLARRSRTAGVRAVLRKPFDPEQLLAEISKALA